MVGRHEVHVVDDDVVEDDGDGDGFGKVLVRTYQKFRNALDERKRWNGKEVRLPDFSSGFVVYTNQANPFGYAFGPDYLSKVMSSLTSSRQVKTNKFVRHFRFSRRKSIFKMNGSSLVNMSRRKFEFLEPCASLIPCLGWNSSSNEVENSTWDWFNEFRFDSINNWKL